MTPCKLKYFNIYVILGQDYQWFNYNPPGPVVCPDGSTTYPCYTLNGDCKVPWNCPGDRPYCMRGFGMIAGVCMPPSPYGKR